MDDKVEMCGACGVALQVEITDNCIKKKCIYCGSFEQERIPLWQHTAPKMHGNSGPSRNLSCMIGDYFGFMPSSVWHITKDRLMCSLARDSNRDIRGVRSAAGNSYSELAFSEFNPVVAERVIKFWSDKGDLVLDPFSGRATRGLIAKLLGRRYIGYEISPLTYEHTLQVVKGTSSLEEHASGQAMQWELLLGDGCKLERTGNEVADLVFTCPPYWDIEKYQSVEGQLSDSQTYLDFLRQYKGSLKNSYRCLKPGKFCIYVVNDFRRDGVFIPFHRDTIMLAEDVGFRLHDIVINQLNSASLARGVQNFANHYFTAKSHEYILVFYKGG